MIRLYFSKNVPTNTRRELSCALGVREVSDLGVYLGVPLLHSRVTKKTYSYILDRMKSRIATWNASRLSFAGRVTLAQSALCSMPLYAMQTAKIPIGSCQEMEKCVRNFVWGGDETSRKMSRVAWHTVQKSKDEGGLGLRDFHIVNNAFGLKLCWSLYMDSDSLWVKVLKSKYKFDGLLDKHPISLGNSSSIWRLICDNWAALESNIAWSIGNGHCVKFWHHIWIPGNFSKLLDVASGEVPDDLIDENLAFFVKSDGTWDWDKFTPFLPHAVVAQIATVMPPVPSMGMDVAFWAATSSGIFSVKSAYSKLANRVEHNNLCPWSVIWKWEGPQRIRSFFWLLLNNGLMTNAERVRRHIAATPTCSVCMLRQTETCFHVLRDCPIARRFWDSVVPIRMRDFFFDQQVSLHNWIFLNLKTNELFSDVGSWSGFFGAAIWLIWKNRNQKIFTGVQRSHLELRHQVLQHARWHRDALRRTEVGTGRSRDTRQGKWSKPPAGVTKLNCDAAVHRQNRCAAVGGAFRDEQGHWMLGFGANLGQCPILKAELWSVYHGLKFATEQGFRKLIVENDNVAVISMLARRSVPHATCLPLVRSIWDLGGSFDAIEYHHVHREANCVADGLASFAYSLPMGPHMIPEPPGIVRRWLSQDHNSV